MNMTFVSAHTVILWPRLPSESLAKKSDGAPVPIFSDASPALKNKNTGILMRLNRRKRLNKDLVVLRSKIGPSPISFWISDISKFFLFLQQHKV